MFNNFAKDYIKLDDPFISNFRFSFLIAEVIKGSHGLLKHWCKVGTSYDCLVLEVIQTLGFQKKPVSNKKKSLKLLIRSQNSLLKEVRKVKIQDINSNLFLEALKAFIFIF